MELSRFLEAEGVGRFSDAQLDYFEHLLSSWFGWKLGKTGFIMPSDDEMREIKGKLKRAIVATRSNRP
ncbi:hypothetical protein EN780_03440 [Mesorhizobium sp. M4B.F.Ca.ET.089.01.1.1]|uniref:hypothetical protein n=1 Tax=Mesorhizobium sp. M4B.F.Ca.ET.089.01.1.1 TaxID=2496662 RepID=UPI000FE3D88F|nr:hypothetical protein [Mesorhizobium sp. M4B.F.Ca.ET.089.01.1.1]RWX70461.1 hypothetical protein EN780_03440 [Mesorhizobium sp. M4B.F.Ca.ET.089.01.1.1]